MKWFRDALKHDNFRYNRHFTDPEIKDLLAFRQAPLPIGLTAAICEMAEALFTASDPIPKVIPIPVPSDQEERKQIAKSVGHRYDAALKSTWRDSFGSLQLDKVIRDYNNVGLGYHYVVPRSEFGQFSVDYKHLPWYQVYVDPSSKDFLFRDAEAILFSMVLSLKQGWMLARQVQDGLTMEKFKEDWVKNDYIDDPTDIYVTPYISQSYLRNESVRFVMRIALEEQTVYQIIPKTENVKVQYKVVFELSDELKQAEKSGLIAVVQQKAMYLTEYTSIGSYGWKKVYPIRNLNIIPTIYDHRECPFPHGRVWYIYPVQRALNKFIGLSILNASLSNSLRFFIEEGSITDPDKITDFASIPGVFIKWKRTHPDAKGPIPIAPIPLSDAFLAFPKFLIYMMEYISGIWSVMQGNPQESSDVFSTVAALQSAGGLKIKRRLRNIEVSMSQVGRVIAEFYKEYAPPNGLISNVIKGDIQTIDYNKVSILKKGILGMGKTVGFEPETDLSIGFKDVEFTMESNKGFQAATEAALLANTATQLKIPELVPLILDRLGIEDVDKVVERIDRVAQMTQKIQEQEQAMQKLQGENQKLQNEVVGNIKQIVAEKAKGRAGRVVERFRSDLTRAGVNLDEFEEAIGQELTGGGNGQQ